MILIKDLDQLELNNYYEYYHYIGESYINRQFTQVKDLCGKLSDNQKLEAYDYIENTWGNNADLRIYFHKLLK